MATKRKKKLTSLQVREMGGNIPQDARLTRRARITWQVLNKNGGSSARLQ